MKRFLYFSVITLFFVKCVSPENYAPPLSVTIPEYPKTNSSLQAIWERVQQSETDFLTFEKDEEALWVSGIVSSSDATGNFYKEIYLQDTATLPKRALRILMDQTALHTKYPVGRKLLIKLNGLGAGMHKGVLTLGTYQADGIASLPEPLIVNHIIRTDVTFDLEPFPVSLAAFHTDHIGKWIRLSNVQFAKGEQGKTFSGEAFDTFDGERRLVACKDQRSILLSSSKYSKFKSLEVSTLSGGINGILTRDYYNEKYILKINTPQDIAFQSDRCDPYFEEDFESNPLGRFEKKGWQNIIEQGTQYWEVYEDANSLGQSLRIGSYHSKDKKTVAWLLTPEFDLSDSNPLHLHFRTSSKYPDKSKLEIFMSTDYSAEIDNFKKAHWTPITTRIVTNDDDEQLWIDNTPIQLPKGSKKVTYAFRYTGNGKTTYDGSFELDDIRLLKTN